MIKYSMLLAALSLGLAACNTPPASVQPPVITKTDTLLRVDTFRVQDTVTVEHIVHDTTKVPVIKTDTVVTTLVSHDTVVKMTTVTDTIMKRDTLVVMNTIHDTTMVPVHDTVVRVSTITDTVVDSAALKAAQLALSTAKAQFQVLDSTYKKLLAMPPRVDTVKVTDPLLDTVLTDALITPYRDSIRALKDSLAKYKPPPIASTGCPDSTPGAIVVHYADMTAGGAVARPDIAPSVICGPTRIAYAMQTFIQWELAGPCPCRNGPVNDTTANPFDKVVLSPADTSATGWDPLDSLLKKYDTSHWDMPASPRIRWKTFGGLLYKVLSDAQVLGPSSNALASLDQWWSYVPTQSELVRAKLTVASAITTNQSTIDVLVTRTLSAP